MSMIAVTSRETMREILVAVSGDRAKQRGPAAYGAGR
jgi:hypothetical protein